MNAVHLLSVLLEMLKTEGNHDNENKVLINNWKLIFLPETLRRREAEYFIFFIFFFLLSERETRDNKFRLLCLSVLTFPV